MRSLKKFRICALSLASILAILFIINSCGETSTEPENNAGEIPADVMTIANDHATPFSEVDGEISKFTPSNTIYDPPYDNYDLYSITLLWGDLYSDLYNSTTPPSVAVDWSGRAEINGVATIDIVYEIDFEAGEDFIVSVDNPAVVAWESAAGDLDGITMLVYLDRDITYITAPKFWIKTEQIDLEFEFHELMDHASIHPVSNTQAMVVVGKQLWSQTCPHGTMVGEWIRDDISGNSGNMHGTWYDDANNPAGLFSGQFEKTNSGVGVFNGSVSGYITDEVIYEFRGTWTYDDPRLCPLCGTGHGQYWGVFSDMNGKLVGAMKGEFGYADDVTDDHLPLQGVWREFCNDVAFTDNVD